MTDKKYTNEEIEKALSLCSRTMEVVYCDQCPLYGEYECIREIKVSALDLINRQKSEIERLNEKVEELSNVLSDTIRIRYAEAKAEVCKEFAEKLKQHKRKMKGFDLNEEFWDYAILVETIDNLLKE